MKLFKFFVMCSTWSCCGDKWCFLSFNHGNISSYLMQRWENWWWNSLNNLLQKLLWIFYSGVFIVLVQPHMSVLRTHSTSQPKLHYCANHMIATVKKRGGKRWTKNFQCDRESQGSKESNREGIYGQTTTTMEKKDQRCIVPMRR